MFLKGFFFNLFQGLGVLLETKERPKQCKTLVSLCVWQYQKMNERDKRIRCTPIMRISFLLGPMRDLCHPELGGSSSSG